MENGLLTYEMLKEISRAKKDREDELKVINLDIPHYNASSKLSIVQDENYEKNVDHHQQVESKARQYKSEWKEDGLPSRIKDAEVVEVGQGSIDTANKWRERLNEANKELKKLKPSQREYKTASEDEGSAKVSRQARQYFIEPTTCERRGKHNRPIAYLRTSVHDELSSSDYIVCNGKKFPIDQLAWVYADMELRGYTGRLLIIVDNGSQKTAQCSKGMSHLLDSIQKPDFGAVFMTTPNRTFDDAVAFQMLLEAEQIYDGLKIHCSQDTGKCRMEGARKVTERKIRRQAVTDKYNKTKLGVDERFASTLSVPHHQLHERMKRAARWNLSYRHLETVSSIQAVRYGSVNPWITETLRLMNERNAKKGKKRKAVQPLSIEGKTKKKRLEQEEKKKRAEKKRLEQEEKKKRAEKKALRTIFNPLPYSEVSNQMARRQIEQEKQQQLIALASEELHVEAKQRQRKCINSQATRKRNKQRTQDSETLLGELGKEQLGLIRKIADTNQDITPPEIGKLLSRSVEEYIVAGIRVTESEIKIPLTKSSQDRNRINSQRSRKKRKIKGGKVEAMIKQLKSENALLLEYDNTLNVDLQSLLDEQLRDVHYQATHTFMPSDSNQLSFQAGEMILVKSSHLSRTGNGWAWGYKVGTEKYGWCPLSFLKKLDANY